MADIFAEDFTLDSGEHKSKEIENQPNPFSFSKFVCAKTPPVSSKDASTSSLESKTYSSLNQLTGDEGEKENPYSFQKFKSPNTSRNSSKKLQIIDDGDDLSSTPTSSCTQISATDKKVNGCDSSDWNDVRKSQKADTTDSEEDANLVKIDELCKENTSLRNDLSKMREEFLEYRRTANKRVTCLQKELEKVRKKEAEDTQDLENAVRMVEENLQKTTARATTAESTVSRLKEELNFLKEENVPKVVYDTLLLEHNHLLNTVQEKSRSVAQLMRTAAEKTEPHVKQLQSGIASLRFFAQQFDDICKVTEVPVKKNTADDVT